MNRLLSILLLLWSCATTQPTTQPTTVTKIVYVHDSVWTVERDTVRIHDTIENVNRDSIICYRDTINLGVYFDTCAPSIKLDPVVGDSYKMIQDAIDFYINSGIKIIPRPGDYYISQPLVIAKLVNGQYKQSSIAIEGVVSAKNSSGGYARIIPMFTNAFAIGIQQGKQVSIKNLCIQGKYTKSQFFTAIQVDTLKFSEWGDGVCSENVSSPYAGIAIDFASDPEFYDGVKYKMYPGLEKWYVPGMNRGGSTAITMDGLSIQNFIIGVIVTPSNQANGDIIGLYNSAITNVKVAYALCQQQSKTCEVKNLHIWGQAHTVFDNVTYGFRHGDGAATPYIEVVNLAGLIHQIFNIQNYTFGADIRKIYAEGLFKIGQIGGTAGVLLEGLQIDFACGNGNGGFPMPDFFLKGTNIIHRNCMYRLYPGFQFSDNKNHARIIINDLYNTFQNGNMNLPPLVTNTNHTQPANPLFQNVSMYYGTGVLNRNDYDSIWVINRDAVMSIDKTNWTGSFLNTSNSSGLKIGDLLITQSNYEDQFSNLPAYAHPIGYITKITKDSVYIGCTAWGINNGDHYMVWDTQIKSI